MQPSRFVVVRDYDVRRAVHEAFLQANEQALATYIGERREQYASLKLEGILEAPQNLCVLSDPQSERGTSSHVGKSLLTAALCRIFTDQGVSVAPFKSQNMSLNSSATMEGLEIGRAQALQAEAARIPASVHMNPILLKPAGNMTSQVVVRKIWGRLSASDYHQRRVEELLPIVRESYEILAAKHEVIILEGAGSPAEINLKQHDIVNMRMAEIADAVCLLVGDIDRGGIFASLLGTVQLLDATEQTRIQGFLINKFRGDIALLEPGVRMMEDRLQKPCLGSSRTFIVLRSKRKTVSGSPT
jgi:adenosylcobyric acid synthase